MLVAAIFAQTARHDFVGYDDPNYVTDNPHITAGPTPGSVAWALTATYAANWHPLTWVSHMLDISLFGMDPRGHHLMSVLWHGANAILLFLVLLRMSGAFWKSALVAALFAAHPLHVETVAWVSERKDLLSTFFGLLVILLYLRRARRRRPGHSVLVPAAFAVGLMAKPMLVTLPALLLLLDFWPLGRWPPYSRMPPGAAPAVWKQLLSEKIPLFVLAIASCFVTYRAQQQGGMVKSFELYPFDVRLANALTSYVGYLWKTLCPWNLAMPYPHPGVVEPAVTAGAALLLAGVTVLAVSTLRNRPFVAAGWFWYLGMLLPVIGLVQVSDQGMADRYTYLPLVGIFVSLVWAAGELVDRHPRARPAAVLAAGALLVALSVAAWHQTGHWRDNMSLMDHALKVTRGNWMLHNNMGFALSAEGKQQQAEPYLREALRIKPGVGQLHFNLANLLNAQGRSEEAIPHYWKALNSRPDAANAHRGLGLALEKSGDVAGALRRYRQAVVLGERGNYPQSITLKPPRGGGG